MFANVWNSPLMLLLAGREKVHLSEIVPSQGDPGLPSPRQHSQSGADVIWESRNPFFWVKIPLTFLDGSRMLGRVEKEPFLLAIFLLRSYAHHMQASSRNFQNMSEIQ